MKKVSAHEDVVIELGAVSEETRGGIDHFIEDKDPMF